MPAARFLAQMISPVSDSIATTNPMNAGSIQLRNRGKNERLF